MERKLETKAVKSALLAAGINCTVSHGTGTAWGWLEINVGSSDQYTHPRTSWCDCPECKAASERIFAISRRAIKIAQEVTGRHGEYDGEISCLMQHGWNQKEKKSFEILQDGGHDYSQAA